MSKKLLQIIQIQDSIAAVDSDIDGQKEEKITSAALLSAMINSKQIANIILSACQAYVLTDNKTLKEMNKLAEASAKKKLRS